MKIFKYQIPIKDKFNLRIPGNNAQFIKLQLQDEIPCLWALVRDQDPLYFYNFRLYGTGHEIDVNSRIHIGTFQLRDFVGHLFLDQVSMWDTSEQSTIKND